MNLVRLHFARWRRRLGGLVLPFLSLAATSANGSSLGVELVTGQRETRRCGAQRLALAQRLQGMQLVNVVKNPWHGTRVVLTEHGRDFCIERGHAER